MKYFMYTTLGSWHLSQNRVVDLLYGTLGNTSRLKYGLDSSGKGSILPLKQTNKQKFSVWNTSCIQLWVLGIFRKIVLSICFMELWGTLLDWGFPSRGWSLHFDGKPIYNCSSVPSYRVCQYKLWSFQTGATKLDRFLPNNQHTLRNFENFENWTTWGASVAYKNQSF